MTPRKEEKQVKRRHHSVPASYLRRFAEENGLLWVFGRNQKEPFQQSPSNIGFTKYLYAPLQGPDPHDDSLENWLADNIDGPAVAPIGKLIKGEQLSDQDRYQVAAFLAYQELRIPRSLTSVQRFEERAKQIMATMYAAHPDAVRSNLWRQDISPTEEQLKRTVAELRLIGRGERSIEATKRTWLSAFEDLEETIEIVFSLYWVVAVAPKGFEFVTSDAPLVKVLTDHRVPKRFAGGWLSPSAEARFPLDPQHVLIIHQHPFEGRVDYPLEGCTDINQLTVSHAQRFVFSRSKQAFISETLNCHGQ